MAAFCAPGLEEIAAPLVPFATTPQDAVSLVGFLSARAACRSAVQAEEELSDRQLWDRVRRVAETVERELPAKPPTFEKLRHLRSHADDDLDSVLVQMQDSYTAVWLEVARMADFLDPANRLDPLNPVRANTLYCDGTWWKAWSSVFVDPNTGKVRNSRAKHSPNVADVQVAKKKKGKDKKLLVGVPFVMCGVRDDAHGRVILGSRRFVNLHLGTSTGEMPAAMDLLLRIIDAADGGVGWVVYDLAMLGKHLNQLASRGVIGVAAMKAATSKSTSFLKLDESGIERFNGDSRKQKAYVSSIGKRTHRVNGAWCDHGLSAVDGSLRTHRVHEAPSIGDPLCPIVDIRFEPVGGRSTKQRMIATFHIPCPHEVLFHDIELTGYLPGGGKTFMLNRLRPFNEYEAVFAKFTGWRQDAESLNSTTKQQVYWHGRASSLDPRHVELDMIGISMQLSTQWWDNRFGKVSHSAQRNQKKKSNKALRFSPEQLLGT